MLKEERHQKILSEVSLRNRVLLNDIAEHLDVSVDTVRRDVKELDKKQLLKKVHGGAISLGFTSNKNSVEVYDIDEKQLMKAMNWYLSAKNSNKEYSDMNSFTKP